MKKVFFWLLFGTFIGGAFFLNGQSEEKEFAVKFFDRCRTGDIAVSDFHKPDDISRLCVDKIKLRFEFLKQLHAKFGEDAVHDFNHSMESGKIYLLIMPTGIEKEKIVVKEIGDREYLFGYPNLDLWPISYKKRVKVDLTNYLINGNVDLLAYKNSIRVEIEYMKFGLTLMNEGKVKEIKNLRQAMEAHLKSTQDKLEAQSSRGQI